MHAGYANFRHAEAGEVSLASILRAIGTYPRLLACLIAMFLAASLLMAYLLPVRYSAHAALPPTPSVNFYRWALQSDDVAAQVVSRLDLASHYGVSPAAAVGQLQSNVQVRGDTIVEIHARDGDPEFAARLVNAYLDVALAELRRLRLTPEARQLYLLETRRQTAMRTADKLRVADPAVRQALATVPEATRARVVSTARMQAVMIEQTMAMQGMPEFLAGGIERGAVPIQSQMLVMQQEMLRSTDLGNAGLDSAQLAALELVKAHEYWSAMVSALDDRIELLKKEDEPLASIRALPPSSPAEPSRRRIALLGTLLGLGVAVVIVAVTDAVRRARR